MNESTFHDLLQQLINLSPSQRHRLHAHLQSHDSSPSRHHSVSMILTSALIVSQPIYVRGGKPQPAPIPLSLLWPYQ